MDKGHCDTKGILLDKVVTRMAHVGMTERRVPHGLWDHSPYKEADVRSIMSGMMLNRSLFPVEGRDILVLPKQFVSLFGGVRKTNHLLDADSGRVSFVVMFKHPFVCFVPCGCGCQNQWDPILGWVHHPF